MDFKDIGKLNLNIDPNKLANMQPRFTAPVVPKGVQDALADKRRKEDENYENLKRIAAATEDINAKFDYVSKDLDYILNSLGANFQRLERLGIEEKETLDQILLALQYRGNEDSKSKIKSLLADKGTDFVLNVILALVQLKMTGA